MDGDDDNDQLTVDEVARAAGTTSRNVRSYQTRGLIPPPKLTGRVGFYGRMHLARLKLVSGLQKRGYSLAAIGDLIAAWDQRQTLGQLLGLERALSTRYQDERHVIINRDELYSHFPMVEANLELLAAIVDLELIDPIPSDRPGSQETYRVRSPKLFEVARLLLDAGIPPEAALEELAALREQARATAARLVALFTKYVWEPWVEAGRPMAQVPTLIRKVRQLQPAPPIAVSAVMAQALDSEIGRAVAALLPDARTEDAHPEESDPGESG